MNYAKVKLGFMVYDERLERLEVGIIVPSFRNGHVNVRAAAGGKNADLLLLVGKTVMNVVVS